MSKIIIDLNQIVYMEIGKTFLNIHFRGINKCFTFYDEEKEKIIKEFNMHDHNCVDYERQYITIGNEGDLCSRFDIDEKEI